MSRLDSLYSLFRSYADQLQQNNPQSIVGLILYQDGSGNIEVTSYHFRSEYTDIQREYPVKFNSISEGIRKLEELNANSGSIESAGIRAASESKGGVETSGSIQEIGAGSPV